MGSPAAGSDRECPACRVFSNAIALRSFRSPQRPAQRRAGAPCLRTRACGAPIVLSCGIRPRPTLRIGVFDSRQHAARARARARPAPGRRVRTGHVRFPWGVEYARCVRCAHPGAAGLGGWRQSSRRTPPVAVLPGSRPVPAPPRRHRSLPRTSPASTTRRSPLAAARMNRARFFLAMTLVIASQSPGRVPPRALAVLFWSLRPVAAFADLHIERLRQNKEIRQIWKSYLDTER